MFDEYNDMVTIEEVMEMLGIGKNTAYELLKRRELKCFQIKGRWKIPKQAVIEYISTKSSLSMPK